MSHTQHIVSECWDAVIFYGYLSLVLHHISGFPFNDPFFCRSTLPRSHRWSGILRKSLRSQLVSSDRIYFISIYIIQSGRFAIPLVSLGLRRKALSFGWHNLRALD